ncbi:hypothetical protein Tco_0935156 [Tanacetum coccineum]
MIKGLADSTTSGSNLRDIQVRDIVKEVEDHLKTYSLAEMDIRCRGGSHVTNVLEFDEEDFSSWKDSAKAIWTDLILTHEGPSETKDTKIDALRLKFNAFKALEGEKVNGTFTRLRILLNDLENNGVSIP